MLAKNSLLMSNSSIVKELLVESNKISHQKKSLIITGQIGTEKELLAKLVHDLSGFSEMPFFNVKCGSNSEKAFLDGLLDADNKLHVALSCGGTILLEEIEKISQSLQQEIINYIENTKNAGTFIRLIGTSVLDSESVKIIFIDTFSKLFSEDILGVPSLREREEDIPVLMKSYLERFNFLTGHRVELPDEKAMHALVTYSWPGNICELENVIEQLTLTKEKGVIKLEDLSRNITKEYVEHHSQGTGAVSGWDFPKMALPEAGLNLKEVVTAFENYLVDQALSRTKGNKNKASALLKMNRTTLVEKLRKRGMITPLKAKQLVEDSKVVNTFEREV